MEQQVIYKQYKEIEKWLKGKKTLLVCGGSMNSLEINQYFTSKDIVRFSDFNPNPTYESVVAGVQVYKAYSCDAIVAVGGGSAIDVAKCIKLFCNMDSKENYLNQKITASHIPFMVIPTTAGTGSEATKFAVIYYGGIKQSVTHESCIPETVFFDESVLEKLPLYQKKVTLMDAFCHAIEAFWSVNSTKESKEFSKVAIEKILQYKDSYLASEFNVIAAKQILEASYLAGKAINITQTTAGHAMSYKLTGLYGISHGHAVALCVSKLWPYMIEHIENCIDIRGNSYLENVFQELAVIMKTENSKDAAIKFREIVIGLNLEVPCPMHEDFALLKKSVNLDRLKNNPIKLSEMDLEILYHQILEGGSNV